jgi:hypothetical protein
MGRNSEQKKLVHNDIVSLGAAILGSSLPAVDEPEVQKRKRLQVDCNYAKELARLQAELVKLQEWVRHKELKVVVIFEGRDAAGKGGTIKRITESLNPRVCRVVALAAPTERERTQWYFQRYAAHLPAADEIVLFDRSWYNRAGVERVMGFCTEPEYLDFLHSCPHFERMLVRSGIILIKYWFMGYLLDSGSHYILWSAASACAKHFTIDLYGAGPTATACSARRRKSFPRLREFRRLKRNVNSSR